MANENARQHDSAAAARALSPPVAVVVAGGVVVALCGYVLSPYLRPLVFAYMCSIFLRPAQVSFLSSVSYVRQAYWRLRGQDMAPPVALSVLVWTWVSSACIAWFLWVTEAVYSQVDDVGKGGGKNKGGKTP